MALFLLYLGVSWFPFVPELPTLVDNQVETIGAGLRFSGTSLAVVPEAADWFAGSEEGEEIEIALRLRSASADQEGPARVFSLGADLRNQELIVGQEGTDLIVRRLLMENGRSELFAVRVVDVMEPERWRDVHVRVDGRATVTVDGRERASEPFPAISGGLDPRTELSLGAETSGTRSWAGDLAAATITIEGVRHDLLAREVLEVPDTLWRLPDRLDETGSRSPRKQLLTAAAHLMLSFAVGVLTVAATARSIRLVSLLVGWAGTAVLVNLVKVGVAYRHPSLATALLQVGGGWLGIVAASAAVVRGAMVRRNSGRR